MTPRNLFNIVLKKIGLFFIIEIINAISQIVPTIMLFRQEGVGTVAIWIFGIPIITIMLYCIVLYQLLFNTNNIISKLKLDQGFDQTELIKA